MSDAAYAAGDAAAPARLANFPISFFATVMGLSGFALATLRLEQFAGVAHRASFGVLVVSAAVFVVIAALYATKIRRHPAEVHAEWRHPVKLAFFPTISISLVLLGTATQVFHAGLGLGLWAVGTVAHLVATLAIVSMWINGEHFEAPHLNPAWFIPAVGNVLVPLVGARYGYVEVSWLYLSMGLLFWIILLTIVFNRLIFHHPMPPHLLPTLCILIAPPAVAFLAYESLVGEVDGFARLLYYPAVMFFLLVAIQLPRLFKLPFALSWWAYSFPVAALTVATFVMAERTGLAVFAVAGAALYGLLVAIVGWLVVRTVLAIRNHHICRPHL
ncbi:MAG: C4-dicarboxylate ABC transporter [Alphaproteobacteria bacterium]|jgi:tellurite resistance protein|nr:C4-dicarboxylate ABC transporter [Alphaproteobacteria bacterium]